MNGTIENGSATVSWRGSWLRRTMWAAAAGLLALPAVAMRFTAEVDWTPGDFVIMGVLIATACAAVEVGMRMSGHLAYRAGVVVGVGGAFLLVWVNLAVGVLGSEDNPSNLMYLAVLLTGLVGAPLVRFRARGLVRVLLAMAAVQVAVPVVALAADPAAAGPMHMIVGVTAFFLGPWLLAAALFRMAADADMRGRAA